MQLSKITIKRPLISEKATDLTALNKYVFIVHPDANKNQVKEAVEEIYKVNVLQVNIMRNRKKADSHKKAIVTIKEGESIDVIAH